MRRVGVGVVTAVVLLLAGEERALAEGEPDSRAVRWSVPALDQAVERTMTELGMPGVVAGVVDRDGLVWAGAFGNASAPDGAPLTLDTPLRVGSISKNVIALAVLAEVGRGRMTLAARLSDVAPEIVFDNPWEASNPLELRHLLEHSTGWDDMRPAEMLERESAPTPLRVALESHPSTRRCRWPPGTRVSYSNVGYGVLGYLLEKVDSAPFEDVAATEVLAPLGMKTATFRWSAELEQHAARGHLQREGAAIPQAHMLYRPAGELVASARDLAALTRFWLRRDEIASLPSFVARLDAERPRVPVPDLGTGFGLGQIRREQEGLLTQGHEGAMDGFSAELRYARDAGLGWFIVTNAHQQGKGLAAVRHLLVEEARHHMPLAAAPAPPPLEHQAPEDVDGEYALQNPRFQMRAAVDELVDRVRVRRANDGVTLTRGRRGTPERVSLDERLRVWRAGDVLPSAAFVGAPGSGALAFVDGDRYYVRTTGLERARTLGLIAALVLTALAPLVFVVLLLLSWRWPSVKRLRDPLAPTALGSAVWVAGVVETTGMDSMLAASSISVGAILLYVGGLTLAGGALASAVLLARSWRELRWRALAAGALALSAGGVALWLARYGVLGVCLWRYGSH